MTKRTRFKKLTPQMVATRPPEDENFKIFSEIWKQHADKREAWHHIHDVIIRTLGGDLDGEGLVLYGRDYMPDMRRGYTEHYVGLIYLAMPGLVFFENGHEGGVLKVDMHGDKTSSLRVHPFKSPADTVYDIEIVGRSGQGRYGQPKFEKDADCSAYIKIPGNRDDPDEFLGIDKSRWRVMYPTLRRWFPGLKIV